MKLTKEQLEILLAIINNAQITGQGAKMIVSLQTEIEKALENENN